MKFSLGFRLFLCLLAWHQAFGAKPRLTGCVVTLNATTLSKMNSDFPNYQLADEIHFFVKQRGSANAVIVASVEDNDTESALSPYSKLHSPRKAKQLSNKSYSVRLIPYYTHSLLRKALRGINQIRQNPPGELAEFGTPGLGKVIWEGLIDAEVNSINYKYKNHIPLLEDWEFASDRKNPLADTAYDTPSNYLPPRVQIIIVPKSQLGNILEMLTGDKFRWGWQEVDSLPTAEELETRRYTGHPK